MASPTLLESVYTGLGNLSALIPAGANVTAVIAHAIDHLFSASAPTPGTSSTWQDTLSDYTTSIADLLAGRTALENTSILLALCTFLVLAMSWTSRFGNLGRFSPFTRSPPQGSAQVSDADFSYITADDLRKHEQGQAAPSHHHHQQQPIESPIEYGPPRDTDVLILKNKKREFAVHFPTYSIPKGELTIGQVREQAARKIGTADTRRVKLLYRGKNLKDDMRTCKQEGLRDKSELMLTVADLGPSASASEDDDDDDEFAYLDGGDHQTSADGDSKRRRNRGKKSKRRNKRDQVSGSSTPAEQAPPPPNLNLPSQFTPRAPSPKPPTALNTPVDKINAIRDKLGEYLPEAYAFQSSPPADPAKKDFEHKRLSEMILAQVLLKLDAVETDGDPEARQRRKDLVRETQKVLQDLDAVMK